MGGAVLFDLDGTLLDSLEDIGDAMNAVLASLGHPTHTMRAYQTLVGEGARELARRALPPEARGEVDHVLARYKAHYRANLVVKSKPYDGIATMLEALARASIPMAVVTNKPHDVAVDIVAQVFAPHTFAHVIGQRDGHPHKPDPSGALAVVRALGVDPAQAFFVGDTDTDMRTARNAGMRAIGVTWGFRDRDELERHGAHVIVDQPDEIVRLVVP
ncbi:MAG: HAD family hydrolase [Deltaproteobacteria bacterium]|nr:HAD family hydrolase [Deltaproteobacteria bacterium]